MAMDSVHYPFAGYRQEAERIYDAGKKVVIETLLAMGARINALEQRILELERIIAALTRNSSNSSRPPSSDLPGAKKTKRTTTGNRKQGGQPGHKGKNRELLPPEEMDLIHNLFPERYACCQLPFSSVLLIPSQQPTRHQVFELPVVIPAKEEYRVPHLTLSVWALHCRLVAKPHWPIQFRSSGSRHLRLSSIGPSWQPQRHCRDHGKLLQYRHLHRGHL